MELKLAEDGEILVRGGNVFVGYYKNPQATEAALEGGWLHTGDIGSFEQGQLRIVDRKKDIMITDGGKNIAPAEIEALMRSSPLIQECVLVADRRRFVSALIQGRSVRAWPPPSTSEPSLRTQGRDLVLAAAPGQP